MLSSEMSSEIIALCSDIHTKQINALFGQNVEVFSVEIGDIKKQVLKS
jgi:hypothetical protein